MSDQPFRIVDAHHHLWDLKAINYPWLMARGVRRFFGDPTPIQKNYLPADLREDAGRIELLASVHIQVGAAPGREVDETTWLQSQTDEHGLPSAIVAYCDLEKADVERTLDAHARSDRLRGIRQIVGRSAEEDAQTGTGALLTNPDWRRGLKALAARKLSFDLQLIPDQMHAAADALDAVPELPVALCHAGSPWDQTPAGLANWRAGLERLAARPNTVCKLSGFGMFNHGWQTDDLRPLINTCLDVFGVDRCLFGSNFPVDKLHASYDRLYAAYRSLTAQLSDDDRAALFVHNAVRFYRLTL
ncbi:MAG: amidohydrolase family protein [Pseudomonadota bacterium]